MADVTGKVVVITGSLRPLTRKEAVILLEKEGAVVHNYVSSQTDVLILGDKQLSLFEPEKRSKKYEAATKRIAEGQAITFLSKETFFKLIKKSQQ